MPSEKLPVWSSARSARPTRLRISLRSSSRIDTSIDGARIRRFCSALAFL